MEAQETGNFTYQVTKFGVETPIDMTEEEVRTCVREGKLFFEVIDRTGDSKKIWDPNQPVEVEDAERSFTDLTSKGYRAFRVDSDGEKGELMTKFDASAGRVIMVPQMQGG